MARGYPRRSFSGRTAPAVPPPSPALCAASKAISRILHGCDYRMSGGGWWLDERHYGAGHGESKLMRLRQALEQGRVDAVPPTAIALALDELDGFHDETDEAWTARDVVRTACSIAAREEDVLGHDLQAQSYRALAALAEQQTKAPATAHGGG